MLETINNSVGSCNAALAVAGSGAAADKDAAFQLLGDETSGPFCAVIRLLQEQPPSVDELFHRYIDKPRSVAELTLKARSEFPQLPYLLVLWETSFLLYDLRLEEPIRSGTSEHDLASMMEPPPGLSQSLASFWATFPRKSPAQRAEEFARWLDLWKAALGVRTNAGPELMQGLLQKVLFLFAFDRAGGWRSPELRVERALAGDRTGFDGVDWFREAAGEIVQDYGIESLRLGHDETTFLELLDPAGRSLFNRFVQEIWLLSRAKFDLAVQADAFADAESRMKLWKLSVTEAVDIRRRLVTDDVNVYEPVTIDLDEMGIGWALRLVSEVLEFWRARCTAFRRKLDDTGALALQFDMFQQPNPGAAVVPLPEHALEAALSTSVRVRSTRGTERATLEYLILLHVLELCRRERLPLKSLGCVHGIFG